MQHINSVFSGIGGLEMGLERAGLGEVSCQVEIDPYASRVLAKHWPKARRLGDITEVDFETLEPGGILCGGFPCQNMSRAGDRTGLAGRLSGLWREMVRAIRVVAPRLVVVENVADLLNAGRGMGDVLGDLAALRYDAEWDCIPAASVGAPHLRDRVFILAHPASDRLEGGVPALAGDRQPGEVQQVRSLAGCDPGSGAPRRSTWWAVEPALDRVGDGFRDRPHRIRTLGGAVVPQVAEHVGHVARRLLASLRDPSRDNAPQERGQECTPRPL